MEDGLRAARHDLVMYLDGDLEGLSETLIEDLTEPLRRGEADFVRAKFTRSAGRVTTLTARPLLEAFFPDLAHLTQPLGGIIAADRKLLEKLTFETDYGVDIGLVIDAQQLGARIVEVDVGHLDHDSQSLEALGDMAKQVTRAILLRANRYGRLSGMQIREMQEVERQSQAEFATVAGALDSPRGLALFDMDGTLIRARFVEPLAAETGRSEALTEWLDRPGVDAEERAERIAELFAGADAVVASRKRGYLTAIVTDSYRIAAEIVQRRVFADFSIANLMQFTEGRSLGRVRPSILMRHPDGCRLHTLCKSFLRNLRTRLRLGSVLAVAVGDGLNDECLLREAGVSVAFEPKAASVAEAAQHVLYGSLTALPALVPVI